MSKLRLKVSHFAKSLKKIRPSVSKKTLRDVSEFSRRFGEGNSNDDSKDTRSTISKSMIPELDNSTKQSSPSMLGLPIEEDQMTDESKVTDGGPTRSKKKPNSDAAFEHILPITVECGRARLRHQPVRLRLVSFHLAQQLLHGTGGGMLFSN
ncbi:hypothetical protein J3459_007842 [Metarhizium acridum]|uniref:uncharacterized protein n=1 Tax=Metarhizium acridum TaxID=92637 RepID=UPI001C6CB295|nr:hypothetical protein J3458_006947 [Metarhizium acridum]KAG8426796.1 hypothetical protein J3459_007842 [Metarhizium acridum]